MDNKSNFQKVTVTIIILVLVNYCNCQQDASSGSQAQASHVSGTAVLSINGFQDILRYQAPSLITCTISLHVTNNETINTAQTKFSLFTLDDTNFNQFAASKLATIKFVSTGTLQNVSEARLVEAAVPFAGVAHTVLLNLSPNPISIDYDITANPSPAWSFGFATAVGVIVLVFCCLGGIGVVGAAIYMHKKKLKMGTSQANFKQEMRSPHDLVPLEDPGEL